MLMLSLGEFALAGWEKRSSQALKHNHRIFREFCGPHPIRNAPAWIDYIT